jgi:hypothetical protein
VSLLEERLRENRDMQPAVARCLHCPSWVAEGTAATTRAAAFQHRQAFHPETIGRGKARRPRRSAWMSQNLTREQEEVYEREREKRMWELGIA